MNLCKRAASRGTTAKDPIKILIRIVCCFAISTLLNACQSKPTEVTSQVKQMAEQNLTDLLKSGPGGWIRYFDRDNFTMTVNGRDVYRSYGEAMKGIEILSGQFKQINLRWENPAVKELGNDYAEFEAGFSETMIKKSDSTDHFAGSFSGLAHRTASGWKWRTIHWMLKN